MSPSKCRAARPPTTQGRCSVERATKMNTSPNGQPWTTLSLFEVPPKSRAPNVSRLLNRPSGHIRSQPGTQVRGPVGRPSAAAAAPGASSRVLAAHAHDRDGSQPPRRESIQPPKADREGPMPCPRRATCRPAKADREMPRLARDALRARAAQSDREAPRFTRDEPRARPAPKLIVRRHAPPGQSYVHGRHQG